MDAGHESVETAVPSSAMSSEHAPIVVRRAEVTDRPAVIELLAASLGWAQDEHFAAFFEWKHAQNPFGRSPGWVAVDDGEIVGFRTFVRWEHEAPGGVIHRTVRAVDTATRPSHQGRGIFSRLTLSALDELRDEGVSFVFNTPNDQSRPGYLKMGWRTVGRLPIAARPTSPGSLARMAHARVPAERWSTTCLNGRPAAEALAGDELVDLLRSLAPARRIRTRRTPAYLRWRYAFPPLDYRAVTLTDDLRDGVAIFRLRRRGEALECALCEVLVPEGQRSAEGQLVRAVVDASSADYLVRVGGSAIDRSGFVRLPRQGPILTMLPLGTITGADRVSGWDLALGDVELF
jgi:GNAT superfamily N-acetyltransferase